MKKGMLRCGTSPFRFPLREENAVFITATPVLEGQIVDRLGNVGSRNRWLALFIT